MLWPREPWATSLASSAEYYLRHGYRSTIITVPVPPPPPVPVRPAPGPRAPVWEERKRPLRPRRVSVRVSRSDEVRGAPTGTGVCDRLKQDAASSRTAVQCG